MEKNDNTLATLVEQTDRDSFWPLICELLDLGCIHEFYEMTGPSEYPFGPGRINSSPEQGLDSPKLAQAVKNKWHELMKTEGS